MMMKESSFYNQYESFVNEDLKRSSCGICCVAMMVSELASTVTPKQIAIMLAGLHKNNVRVAKARYLEGNEVLDITLGPADSIYTQNFYVSDPDENLVPAFSILGGYDHRISSQLFEVFDLRAEALIGVDLSTVCRFLTNVSNSYAMISIQHEVLGSRHLVVLYFDILKKSFFTVDPLSDLENYLQRADLDTLRINFNGLATVVSK